MSSLGESFATLINFAKEHNFSASFAQVYFVESNKIQYALSSGLNKIPHKFIYTFESYESHFDNLFDKGHAWINMHLAGVLDDELFVVIETPDYKNNVPREFTSVKYSLPTKRIVQNDWSLKDFYKVFD